MPVPEHVTLHGPTAACHELHGTESFAAAIARLTRARAEGRRVVVSSWLTRSSCRSLVGLVDLLGGHRVAAWAIVWPPREALAPEVVARTVPRLGIAVPHALRAVDRAVRRNLPTVLVGVPLCVLGPFARYRIAVSRVGEHPRSPCGTCSARPQCPGIDPQYLATFGADELRAREVPEAVSLAPEIVAALAGPPNADERA